MEISLSNSVLLLLVGSGREVPCPVVLWLISIREHVVVADWPLNLLFLQCVDVLARGGVHESNIVVVSIEVGDQLVNWPKSKMSITVCEVVSPWNEKVAATVVLLHVLHILPHLGGLLISIEGLKCLICDCRLIREVVLLSLIHI